MFFGVICWRVTLRIWQMFFCHLNNLDISLQGFCTNIFALNNKTGHYKKKLGVWNSFVQKGDTEISQHLKELANNFDYYFSKHEDPWNGSLWINNTFIENLNTCETTALVTKMIVIICCIHCDCMLPVHKMLCAIYCSAGVKRLSFRAVVLNLVCNPQRGR